MEYVFGSVTRGGKVYEILKTTGDAHTNLSGRMAIKCEYSDMIVTDTFSVKQKYESKDTNGKCYDWYVIDNHYRYIDSTKVPNEKIGGLENTTAALEDALCEMDAINEERIAAIEDALCEIDMG